MVKSKKKRWSSPIVRSFWKQVGGRNPYSAIERVCSQLLEQLGKENPPFQSSEYEFAKLLNIRVIENEISCDGLLALAGKRFVIQVKRSATPERKSFTVCHELGHIEIVRRATADSNDFLAVMGKRQGTDEEERLSNFFAANLLMPRDHFLSRIARLERSMDTLFQLAREYRTSIRATALRIVELKAWDCVFFWCLPERLVNERMAVRIVGRPVVSSSVDWPHKNCGYVSWGAECVSRAYDDNMIVKDRLIVRKHNGAKPVYWHLEAARHAFENETLVIALVFPEK
ncbi:MAG TPA: ImmA/IrrE family metallo-endopeptidase [Candidatus Angelobacter sp.]|nr:ImmA/IrrE family metallo-endopeptidase [Candidatus Angelobacter sp.]